MRVGLIGIDGAGKSTLAAGIARCLAARGLEVEVRGSASLAPLKHALGRLARQGTSIPRDQVDPAHPMSAQEQLLYGALKWSSLLHALRPAAPGTVVLIDRTRDCQLVAASVLFPSNRAIIDGLMLLLPTVDRTFWLDLEPHIAAARLVERGEVPNIEFLRRLREGYAARSAGAQWARIDASQPVHRVLSHVVAELAEVAGTPAPPPPRLDER